MTVQNDAQGELKNEPKPMQLLHWAMQAFALSIVGALAVVLALSFAALIYSGQLSEFLGKGASQMLIGGCVLGVCGTVSSSIRGAVLGMQDAPAIILALAAAAIAADWRGVPGADLFSTVATLLAVTTLTFGATLCLLGKFRLGSLVRYLPYPVIGGFMAATGWFLLIGAVSSMSRANSQSEALALALAGQDWLRWGPGLLIGFALFIATRLSKNWLALPLVIGVSFAGFYLALAFTGQSLTWAGEQGLLLGPFPDSSLIDALPVTFAVQADWGAVTGQASFVLTAVAMGIVGMLLNLTGAELTTGQAADVDLDLRRTGVANMISGAAGGGAGYLFISLTLLARKFRALGATASAAGGIACGVTLLFGTTLVGVLPICVFGGLTAFLGIDLLYQWIWVERRRLPALDYGIVGAILIAAATIGFLQGIAVGIAACVGVFIYSCVAAPVVRNSFTNRERFSTIERPKSDAQLLELFGSETKVYQIQGALFFGTISKLSNQIASDIQEANPQFRRIILDFAHVQHLDTSAIYGMAKAAADCGRFKIDLALSGLSGLTRTQREGGLSPLTGGGRRVFTTLDRALEWAEEQALTQHRETSSTQIVECVELFGAQTEDADAAIERYFSAEHVPRGQTLIRQGDSDTDIFFLRKGTLVVEIVAPDSTRTRVSAHFAGTVIGEMALYTGGKRSADVVAYSDCEILRLTDTALARMEAEEPHLAIGFHRSAAGQVSTKLRRTHNLIYMLKA